MVLPAAVLLVKLAGWLHGAIFIALSHRNQAKLRLEDLTESSIGSPTLLLSYRLAMLAWGLFIGVRQLATKGRRVLVFYTVWNWWLLTTYFALASACSLLARHRHRLGIARTSAAAPGTKWLYRATLATFCVVTPMTLLIDGMTWFVLVPMLVASTSNPMHQALYIAIHHNFESYNQHGINAAMALGELLLNRMPVDLYSSGWLALWSSLFAVWSAVFYVRNGRFIYPFLDAFKPNAWLAYLGLFGVHWAVYMFVMGLSRLKERFLLNRSATQEGPVGRRVHAQVARKQGHEE